MDHSTPIERALARCSCALACVLCTGGLAYGQPAGGNKGAFEFVLMATAYVEECIAVDQLLRTSCARVGNRLPDKDKDKKYCELPPTTFEARTARNWAAFKDTYRNEFQENEAAIAKILQQGRESFDRQFARTRAGTISMMDLELLSNQLTGRCQTIESRWLLPNPKPR
jgi:hypothetical protein